MAAIRQAEISLFCRMVCFPKFSECARPVLMNDQDSKLRDRVLAIEFWLAALIVGGAFVVGLMSAAKQLLAP